MNGLNVFQLKNPTQCILWVKEELKSEDLNGAFDIVESYIDESHFGRQLVKCKECGQLYFEDFYEEIDWENGNDPQYTTLIPVETNDEIETLKRANFLELLQFSPRLQKDFPKDANKPRVYWVGR